MGYLFRRVAQYDVEFVIYVILFLFGQALPSRGTFRHRAPQMC